MLCYKCQEVVKLAEHSSGNFSFQHYDNFEKIENAIKLRCPFCCQWRSTLSLTEWQDASDLLRSKQKSIHIRGQLFKDRRTAIHIKFYFLSLGEEIQEATMQNPRGQTPSVSFYLQPEDGHIQAPLHGMDLNYTGDFRVFEQMYRWMQMCRTTHKKCQHAQQVKRRMMPQRLMDLGTLGNMKDGWSLVDGFAPDSGIEFVTVSHRWGDVIPLKLTHVNEEQMKNGMPLSSMTGEYIDAVRITRYLGVRYMWIDSICVMQDDAINIKMEAQKMGEIYAGGVCNLSLLHSPQKSVFVPRYPHQAQPDAIVLPAKLYGFSNSYSIRHTYAGSSEDPRLDEQSKAFLFTRGWILQEQILPRRTIYFGSNQIIWACLEGDACELHPELDLLSGRDFGLAKIRERLLSPDDPDTTTTKQQNLPRQFPDAEYIDPVLRGTKQGLAPFEVHAPWDMVIQRYSHRDLTDETDKIIAIAGIASRYAEQTQDEFVAGMWRRGLAYQLLWSVHMLSDSIRPEKYLGPTWSWTALKAKIEPAHYPGDTAYSLLALVAEVVNVDVTTTLANAKFDIPSSARLTLSAPVLQVTRTSDVFFAKADPVPGDFGGAVIAPGGPRLSVIWDVPAEAAYYDKPLWAVVISVSISCHDTDSFEVDGLILENVDTVDGVDYYERLGRCRVKCSSTRLDSGQEWWRRLYDAVSGSGDVFHTLDFDLHRAWLGVFNIV